MAQRSGKKAQLMLLNIRLASGITDKGLVDLTWLLLRLILVCYQRLIVKSLFCEKRKKKATFPFGGYFTYRNGCFRTLGMHGKRSFVWGNRTG